MVFVFLCLSVVFIATLYLMLQYMVLPRISQRHEHEEARVMNAMKDLLRQSESEMLKQFNGFLTQQQTALKTELLNTLLQTLKHQHEQDVQSFKTLSETVHHRLQDISKQVDTRLQASFEKNHGVFHDVLKRLSLIDAAQKEITSLSENVVALQKVLTDKSSRGAHGEVQLEQLVANIIPSQHFRMQETLPNGKRVDCLLLLPESSGHIAIDSKFPLENYQRQFTAESDAQKKLFASQFKRDIKKHIDDIHDRYIIPNYTGQGAMMFIPAEAVFAHIHAYLPEVVQYSHQKKVWLASPTTLVAVLNTAVSVIKDHSTRAQVDVIKGHLAHLAKDFERFDKRMGQLAKHINQANKDVDLIQQSSTKITRRFVKIESCELDSLPEALTEEDV